MREVVAKHRVDQTFLRQLKTKKVVMEAELRDLKVSNVSLKDSMQGIVILLCFIENLWMAYNEVCALKSRGL